MRVLIVSQYFYPEEFKINDLAEELVKRGHEVTVLTGKPNYPKGEFFEGYRFWGTQEENYKGAKVVRVPLIRRRSGGTIWLVLNYFSYVFFGGLYMLTHKMPYDAIFCFETSPITQAYPAIWAKRKSKAKLSMWVQDLWPESVSAASNIKNPKIINLIDKMVKGIYNKCDKLLIQSRAFSESIQVKGDYSEKIIYAPNWAEDVFLQNNIDKDKYADMIPEGFVVMFAGNIGEAQDFDSIVSAASLTKEYSDIKWVIVGDGRYRAKAQEMVSSNGLNDTVSFLGRFPVTEMPNFFVHADAMLMSLKDEYIFSLTIPSKTQAYMANGRPILTMINGVGNDVVKEANCGLVAHAGDSRTLAENVIKLSKLNKEDLLQMGKNGRDYYMSNFAKEQVVNIIEDCLE